MRFTLLLLAALVVAPAALSSERGAEEEMVGQLGALSAVCSLKAQGIYLESSQPATTSEMSAGFAATEECAADARRQGRSHYQAALKAAPDSRDALMRVYAVWLDYLAALTNPFDRQESYDARTRFESAVNQLQAELDSRL